MKREKVKLNNTSNFLLPLTGFYFNAFKPYLHNAYLNDALIKDKYKYCIFVLLRFTGVQRYMEFEDLLRDSLNYKTDYSLVDSRYTMFVLEIKDEFKKDAIDIVEGKYSKISEKAKEYILKGRQTVLRGDTREKSMISKVLTKDETLKEFWEKRIGCSLNEQEVWSKITVENEIFNNEVLEQLERPYKIKANDSTEKDGICEK
jgi:hypothetical protein